MINLGISGGGKWFDSSCMPASVMVVENRYVLRNAALINNFWDLFVKARDNNIRQIITIDMCLDVGEDDHLNPPEAELRKVINDIKTSLIVNNIKRDKACFQLDNEPAKNDVNPLTYCNQANIIHDVLAGDYDLYLGGEEVSYSYWYNYVCNPSHANYEGIAYHLQSCASSQGATDDSVNFIKSLADKYNKKTTCSEGNYKDPSTAGGYELIKYQIEASRRIGSLDYCVIFLELKNHSKYKWLSFVYDNQDRTTYDDNGNSHYKDYIKLIELEKNVRSRDGMILPSTKYGSKGYLAELVQEILQIQGFYEGEIDGQFYTSSVDALKAFQNSIKDKYPNIYVDGICGRKGYFYLINEIGDSILRNEYKFKLDVYASPME